MHEHVCYSVCFKADNNQMLISTTAEPCVSDSLYLFLLIFLSLFWLIFYTQVLQESPAMWNSAYFCPELTETQKKAENTYYFLNFHTTKKTWYYLCFICDSM